MRNHHHHSAIGEIMMLAFCVNKVMRAKLRRALAEYAQTQIEERSELPSPTRKSQNAASTIWAIMQAGVDLPVIWSLCGLVAWYVYTDAFFLTLGLWALLPLAPFATFYVYLTFKPWSISNAS